MKNLKKNKGFTLIEILVVLGIIAILAAIVIVAVNPAKHFGEAKASTRSAGANSIINAIGQYVIEFGELPTNITTTATEIGSALCAELIPEVTGVLPTDPDSDSEGTSITEGDCAGLGSGDVGYNIKKDANDHVTVCSTEDTSICAAI